MDVKRIRNMTIDPIVQSYDFRDTILYALGLGYGSDPLDRSELPFVYEKDLRCLPSYANLLCHPGFWAQKAEFGIDRVKILHAEQDYQIHSPLRPQARSAASIRWWASRTRARVAGPCCTKPRRFTTPATTLCWPLCAPPSSCGAMAAKAALAKRLQSPKSFPTERLIASSRSRRYRARRSTPPPWRR